MAQYESFDTSKRKIRKTWERNEANTSDIANNLQKFTVDFNSISHSKNITTITVIEKKIV